ncbi:uncharacterized protein LOC122659221 [Telopea speciosissima]|uniref:uncharacterized protein LOC122659221 n=1 Tax=Telopea speciosissima TaxID=54955 RepID=UPI001CC38F12|nr:uncharacterized protein LOC122659221 [Telopea speciosissima]
MDDSDKRSQDMERFHLFDVSTEDDCLLASPSGRTLNLRTSRFTENQKEIDSFGLNDARNAQDGDNTADLIRQKEQIPALSESTEPERTRTVSNCNLRKSLAWDSAFFTSAGVLDPEELSFINNGFSKAEAPLLPVILEDVRRSAESNSTFDSDLTLESIEIDLFEDIRASMQKFSTSSIVSSSRSNTGPVERGTQSLRSSKRIELPSRSMPKPVAASKRQSIGMQNLEKTAKKDSQRSHIVQLASRSGERNSSLKPPKILGRAVPLSAAPTKRTSLGASRIKVEHNTTKAVSGKGDPVVRSKKPGLGDSGSLTPRSSPSSKSSSSGSSPSLSSVNRSGSTSSDCRGKSPAFCSRNKTSSKNVIPASSGSTRVDPVRTSSRTKIDSGNSHLSAYLVSMSKHYSTLSSASSIDGWSSESSSSTSTVNQRSNNSKTSSSPRSGFSIDNDAPQALDLQTHPHGQASFRYGSNGTALLTKCDRKSSVGTGALSHLASTNVSRNIKPSGLRMPSPKIGFFDAEKTALHSPMGGLQGVRNCLPKDGPGISCVNRNAIKTKPGKIQSARTVTGTGKVKSESLHTAMLSPTSNVKPSFEELYEQANASPKVPDSSKKVEDFHSKLSEVHRSSRSGADEYGTGSGPNSEVNGGLDALKNSIVAESERQVSLRAIRIGPPREDELCVSIGKENFFRTEDQVDSLSRTVGSLDLNTDVLNVIMEKSSCCQFDANNPDHSVS